LLAVFAGVIFFAIGLITLKDYGVNWDEPVHFARGQAYLSYLTTGNTQYENLPPYVIRGVVFDEKGNPTKITPPKRVSRSVFQNPTQPPEYWLKDDVGHPPLAGILAAATNRIFHGALGWLSDIEAYHLFEIIAASILVGVVFLFGYQAFGPVAGWTSALTLATYPLFFAEAHFNIKDPVVTLPITLALYFAWRAVSAKKPWLWWLVGGFFGIGLAIKFNALFVPMIIVFWLVARVASKRSFKALARLYNLQTLTAVLGGLVVGGTIFFASWPYLWTDTLARLNKIIEFYRGIGSGTQFQSEFISANGWNAYPLQWILKTTPEVVLLLGAVGISAALVYALRRKSTGILLLIWLAVPILRVSIPGSTIYGGVRQIMEFLPALALLAGLGAQVIVRAVSRIPYVEYARNPWAGAGLATFAFIPAAVSIIALHPNQNVYFNSISGGLNKAVAENFPSAGNTYGNIFLQGVEWLNENAEPASQLALPVSTASSLPVERLRDDIQINDVHFSGALRLGEYVMELSYVGFPPQKTYAVEYLENLTPIHTVTVDGVPLLKIWKNDHEHVRVGQIRSTPLQLSKIAFDTYVVDLPAPRRVWSIKIAGGELCTGTIAGHFSVKDKSGGTQRLTDSTPTRQLFMDENRPARELFFRFAGNEVQQITYVIDDFKDCPFIPPSTAVVEVGD